MSIRDEDLIDYLLGEADAVVTRRVQLALESDYQVAARLDELRAALGLLDSLKSSVDPPFELAERTMEFIDEQTHEYPAVDKFSSPTLRLRSTDGLAGEGKPPRRVWDSAFITLCLTACAALLLPLVVNARSLSRQMRCAENLHMLGQGLMHLAMLDPERRFPAVPTGRADSFPGMYTLRLKDCDLLPSPEHLRCYRLPGLEPNTTHIVCFPTTQEFFQSPAAEQTQLRKWLGGDYAYNYGVIVNGRIVGLPLDGNSHMALLGDAPEVRDDLDLFNGHEGRGINVCFADGHVTLQALSASNRRQKLNGKSFVVVDDWQSGDYPFRNQEGRHAHGLNIHDASLGPSDSEP